MTASRRNRVIRLLLLAGVVAALLALVLWPKSRLVDVATVDRGRVADTIDAEGRTRVRDRYVIVAPIAATARRLSLQPGDRVRAGQVLVVLDPGVAPTLDARARAEARSRIDAAEDRLAASREDARAADAAARQAAIESARLKTLAADRLVAAEAAERSATASQRAAREAASAHALVATVEHELQAAQAVLRVGSRDHDHDPALELTAPTDGVVLRRHYESAKPVQPGETLLEIGDPQGLEVEVDVLSTDAVRLRPAMSVELLRWGESRPLAGRVRRIEPGGFTKVSALGVEEQRVWVIVQLTSPQADWAHLGEAYRVNARFLLRAVDDAARVPASAVFRQDGGDAVFRVAGGRAALTPVRVGVQGGGVAQVLSGLAPGDTVIVHPDRGLADGERVRERGARLP
jgi:HlyD family secretion protein